MSTTLEVSAPSAATATAAAPSCAELAAEYWERGFIVLRGLFSAGEIAAWQAECDRLLKADFVDPKNLRTPFRFNSGNTPERIDPVTDVSMTFAALRDDSRIQQVLEAIFKDKANPFKDKVIFKLPGTDGYTMHQDQAWWHLCNPDDILSVSIQIDGASAANGGIELFPGYHHELMTPAGMKTNFRPEELARVDLSTGVQVESNAGDVLIFHSLTPHRSGKNTATWPRRSLYLTYSAARCGDLYGQHLQEYKDRLADEVARSGGDSYFR